MPKVDKERIRRERESRGWSQELLAEKAGVQSRTIQRVESRGSASLKTIGAIAEAFELTCGELRSVDEGEERTSNVVGARIICEVEDPVIVWCLPRGFMLLEDLLAQADRGWATIAEYYDYDGNWLAGTHYHASYRWRDEPEGFDIQCAKLTMPIGDWPLARQALRAMVDVREGYCTIGADGVLSRGKVEVRLPEHAHVCPRGAVRLPVVPAEFRALARSAPIRDLAAEAVRLVRELERSKLPSEVFATAARIRREARIESYRLLGVGHPATKNIEEIVTRQRAEGQIDVAWFEELTSALFEAARCVEEL